MSEWRDIATAPKDGAKIDAWAVERFVPGAPFASRAYRMGDVYWKQDLFGQGPGWARDYECSPQDAECLLMGGARFLTHWMPLPDPPVRP